MRDYTRPAKRWEYCKGPSYIWPGSRGNVREAVKKVPEPADELKKLFEEARRG